MPPANGVGLLRDPLIYGAHCVTAEAGRLIVVFDEEVLRRNGAATVWSGA